MEQMKRVFSRMLDDPQAPPLRDSAEVLAAARRSARHSISRRVAAATLAVTAIGGSWGLLEMGRNGSSPAPRPIAVPSASMAPIQLTAADVADRLEPRPTPSPLERIMWIIEGKSRQGHVFWYVDTLAPVADPCELPYDVPYTPGESCATLFTPQGEVWVRRQHSAPFAFESMVVSIYVPVSREAAYLYTASNIELPVNVGTWGVGRPAAPFEISDAEITRIAKLAHDLDQS
ncbi:hypothetical protein Rhe02_50320 [Rhizocola hellebori]|uniref:Uncharacterized protein n=1 Tax=Rhizocola hellebori TaxID=1392758 RepID=A0A8J3QCB2_9ACTN|nr:hypothetical protein [Rhizocola hellebori]GIH06965.1 hypothetical protein Rhe02_50320 [Rhizocola hellebori]